MPQGVDLHDAAYFHLSRTEATALDPQARLLLEVSAEALSGCGTRHSATSAKRTGTYVGCMFTDYMPLLRQGHGLHYTGAVMTGTSFPPIPWFRSSWNPPYGSLEIEASETIATADKGTASRPTSQRQCKRYFIYITLSAGVPIKPNPEAWLDALQA